VFEKKNKMSAKSISQLLKKLDSYKKKSVNLEMYGLPSKHHQPQETLQDMDQELT
jgi:hypothetical protein